MKACQEGFRVAGGMIPWIEDNKTWTSEYGLTARVGSLGKASCISWTQVDPLQRLWSEASAHPGIHVRWRDATCL